MGATEDETVGWHHGLSGHELSKLQGMVKDREARHVAVHGITNRLDLATEQQLLPSWNSHTQASTQANPAFKTE